MGEVKSTVLVQLIERAYFLPTILHDILYFSRNYKVFRYFYYAGI